MVSPFLCFAGKTTDSLYKLSDHCFEIGEYAKVLEYGLQALDLLENGTCKERSLANLRVAHAYYHLQQRRFSLQYFRHSLNISLQCGHDKYTRTAYRQMGAIYFELEQLDSAKFFLNKAEKMLENTTYWAEKSSLYAFMGELYSTEPKGKKYYDMAEQYAMKANDTMQIAFANIKQGMYATNNNNCGKGITYIKNARSLYNKLHLVEGEMYALRTLAWALSECGKAQESFEMMSHLQSIRDSIFKTETAEKTAQLRTLYETEKKEKENAELAKQNALKELQIAEQAKSRRMLLAGFAFTILLLIIVFLFIYSRYKLRKQKEIDRHMSDQQQIRFAAVIEAEEKERKRIAVDLHDGVGQIMSAAKINLSVMRNEMQFSSDEQKNAFEKIVGLVDESCNEVRSVSHNMMPNALLKSGLASAIRSFVNQIDSKVISVDFYSEGLSSSLNANKEVVLYRVIQECVNNVIKHAKATHLHIALIKDEDGTSVTIEDNGIGFDATQADAFDGIGLKNIQSRITYLNGTVEWNTSPGRGTAVIINIPM